MKSRMLRTAWPVGHAPGLKAIHDKLEEIPEAYRELYTEKNGKWELTGIAGVKTEADVNRLQTALNKEREEHKATKEKLSAWGDLDVDDVHAKLDGLPALEAAAKGKLDDAKIEEIVQQRVEGTINSRVKPLERQILGLTKERDTAVAERDALSTEKRTRLITDDVRKALVDGKVIPEAQEDALILAERIFEVNEAGNVVTKEGGMSARDWLADMQPKRAHWWPANNGQGGRAGSGGGSLMADNPWSAGNWNLTKQGEYIRQHGREKAAQAAKAAGSQIGATQPPKAKS